jgi:RNA polymerase sigma factor (sigma-70 family)
VDEADGEIYRKYADELTRFANGLVGPSYAADVVADAIITCFSSSQWESVTSKRPYLYRSVYNQAVEFHRSSRRRKGREERAAQPEALNEPADIRPEILAAVSRLSVQQRAVVFLTYWDDLTPTSIANLLNISDGSVRRHLARGRSRLKEFLNADQ